MPKASTTSVSIYGSNRDCWRQDDSYGFTHNSVDYGVAVCGAAQDKTSQVSRLLFKKVTAVLGKTEAERQAAVADIATIAAAVPGFADTDPIPESPLTSALNTAIEEAITAGTLKLIFNGWQLDLAEADGSLDPVDVDI